MNQHLQQILDILKSSDTLCEEEKNSITEKIHLVEKELSIVSFKLDRTEKVKRTTATLLEETIEELEKKRKAIEETNQALQKSLQDLKAAQNQLIQSEKMASLGELTAGIAHEIQNPLNFVNNFSEINTELIADLKQVIHGGFLGEANNLIDNIHENEQKISHHGKRADAIVKGMLQHSRKSRGEKELTDINQFADEWLRLAYHGVRGKDHSFNVKWNTGFDPSAGKISIIPTEIGRVLLNIFNNAFYAVNEKNKTSSSGYEPTVWLQTKRIDDKVVITVRDNGNGIPELIRDKIFQPFFTTKPTGQGTGLGLSLSYDIVTKAHAGELKVESVEGEGAAFIITLPVNP